MKRAFPILAVLTAIFLIYALYQALWIAPKDALQGDVYRIIITMCLGVDRLSVVFHQFRGFRFSIWPNAKASTKRVATWIVLAVGIGGAIAALVVPLPAGIRSSAIATTALAIPAFYFLLGKYFPGERLDVLAVTTAEVGVVFCSIVLVTGPIWARPVWGIWWRRETSGSHQRCVLWLIYVSYLVLRRFSESAQTQMLAAALAVFGDAGRSPGLLLDLVLPHPASTTGDRRRRFDGPAYAATCC